MRNKILLFFVVLLLNSCATLFLPKKQNVTIQTQSNDAKIYVNNEKFGEGLSSSNKISNKGSAQNVSILYGEDYVQKNDVIIPSNKKAPAYYFFQALNVPFILFFGSGILAICTDTSTPYAYAYPKIVRFDEAPRRVPIRNDDSKYIYLSNIGLDLKNVDEELLWHSSIIKRNLSSAIDEAETKRLQARKKQEKTEARKKKKKELLVEEEKEVKFEDIIFTEDLQRTLYHGGFMDTINDVFMDYNNMLFLEGKISKIDLFKIAPNRTAFSGNIYMARTNMTWYIKNSYGEIIDSIADIDFSEKFATDDNIIKTIVGNSVTQLFYNLLENDTFKEHSKLETNFEAKLELTKLKKPNSIVKDKRDAAEASVIIKRGNGHGSGFSITNDGYIVTNYHVLVDREKGIEVDNVTVIDSDGNEMEGTVVKVNKFRDVALIKVDKEFRKAFVCNDSKTFRKMDDVYTIGAPKSITLGQSISSGLISNERKINNNDLIQLNMSVNRGNSGGPIFDDNGNLHGVVVSKLVGVSTEGVSFAIPSYKLSEYLNLEF